MASDRVKEYLIEKGFGDRFTVHPAPCDTVSNAARMIGVSEAEIAKTMSFLLEDDEPILIVSTGDCKIDNRKYKDTFHKKARMIPWDRVETLIGHEPGGVCALVPNASVKVYLDESLKRFTMVYSAAGAPECTAGLSPYELELLTKPECWIDVCKVIESDK